uniref:ATP-dependent DNA helicase n=1 Tax=Octactis speculum TaxID=3111310 RepID=A0A7S2G833_9STRA
MRLAWAVSIHKSQGMTIPLLEVDLNGVFEFGQAYVAMSRAKSLDGLRIACFSPKAIKVHQRVRDFYNHLASQPSDIGGATSSEQAPRRLSCDDEVSSGGWLSRKKSINTSSAGCQSCDLWLDGTDAEASRQNGSITIKTPGVQSDPAIGASKQNIKSSSRLTPAQLERIKESRHRARALLAARGTKMPY